MSVAERLVLKKYAECSSQRLKRTSGARVMIGASPSNPLVILGIFGVGNHVFVIWALF